MKNHKYYLKLNLIFIFIILNIWEFAINRVIFNAMTLGIVMFGPVAFLWYLKKFKAVVLITLISVVEFTVMLVFVAEGLQLSGSGSYSKALFLLPYLIAAFVNGYWGLKIYSENKEKSK